MRRASKAILMILTFALAFLAIMPLLTVVVMAFNDSRIQVLPLKGLTKRWFEEAIASADLRGAFFNSIQIASITALTSGCLGLASAHLVTRKLSMKSGMLYGFLVSIPCLVPLLVCGFALLVYYRQTGLIGTKFGIVIAHTCFTSPFAFAIIRNAYYGLNMELEYAARNLGASESQVMIRVVVPQLAQAIVGAAAVAFLFSWDEFILAWFVGGFHKTIPTAIYGALGTAYAPSINALATLSMTISIVGLIMLLLANRRSRA